MQLSLNALPNLLLLLVERQLLLLLLLPHQKLQHQLLLLLLLSQGRLAGYHLRCQFVLPRVLLMSAAALNRLIYLIRRLKKSKMKSRIIRLVRTNYHHLKMRI